VPRAGSVKQHGSEQAMLADMIGGGGD